MSPANWCDRHNGPDYLCTCKRDGLTGGGGSDGNSRYTSNSNYSRRSPSPYSYASTASRATNYSDVFDRNSTASSASSYNVARCNRCNRPRYGPNGCQCLRHRPYVPNNMSQPSHRRNSPPPRRNSPPPRRNSPPPRYSSSSSSGSGMCYRCRRLKSNCTCIPGTLYNPGGYSNERTAYENHPAFDDEPAWKRSDTRTSNPGGNRDWCERCDRPGRSCECRR